MFILAFIVFVLAFIINLVIRAVNATMEALSNASTTTTDFTSYLRKQWEEAKNDTQM